jgi:hypothetical protein
MRGAAVMKIKTSEAMPPVLDWLVAECEGYNVKNVAQFKMIHEGHPNHHLHFSADWSQGGPIIEREDIDVARYHPVDYRDGHKEFAAKLAFVKRHPSRDAYWYAGMRGPTPLIAGMRCFVASKLGDEVEVPDELVKGE